MSGLPGAGKDTWVRTNLPDWPAVSLDAVRVRPGDDYVAPLSALFRARGKRR